MNQYGSTLVYPLVALCLYKLLLLSASMERALVLKGYELF